jgi:NAD(P) transhydrogenase subunit alpha
VKRQSHLSRQAAANPKQPNQRPKWRKPEQEANMQFSIAISGFVALYIFMLAAFAGWVIIGHVPAILHTPLMSGSNFVHGIVVVGGIFALLNAGTVQEQAIGFFAVLLGAGNAAGGFAVTDRMLAMFQPSLPKPVQAQVVDHQASQTRKA